MILAPFSLIEAGGLTVSESTPAIKQISWAGRPLITCHESDVGPISLLIILSACREALEDATAERRIRVQLRGVGSDRVAIDVEDSGCGIPAENLTRIFHHGFTTRKERLGFGLHTSGCAAGEMGGTLIANSDGPGRGARFTLTLPLRLAELPATSTPAEPAPQD
jgi:nitrogen fixation/metabolism regulation signal transduction histidine kinase